MEEKIGGRPHRLMMEDRGKMSITGIADVVSFDENQVVLDTDKGLLTIKGFMRQQAYFRKGRG